ncbi:hypothetical protein [Microbulbifer sp. S227A]|uniref:hypothetical protein n=1 Tax=Microbulbifer sp. S227A TaxID=3415131 RepID=UPI003C7A358A
MFSFGYLQAQTGAEHDQTQLAAPQSPRDAPRVTFDTTAEMSDVFVFDGTPRDRGPEVDPGQSAADLYAWSLIKPGLASRAGGQETTLPDPEPDPESGPEAAAPGMHDAMLATILAMDLI